MRIERLGPGDEARVLAAAHLFDRAPTTEATRRFLAASTHYLLVAYEDADPAGFVTGVTMTHPDKGTEMFLYELGVDERFRRRGIAGALVDALLEAAHRDGCYGMWTLTEDDNEAALGTYRRCHGTARHAGVMVDWTLET